MFGDSDDASLVEREIGETQAIIGDLAHPDRLFRPNGGGGVISQRLLSASAVSIAHRRLHLRALDQRPA